MYVEVKLVRDLQVFDETTNRLGTCSLLDPRFRAFFSFSGTELGDADFDRKRKEVDSALDAWIGVLDQKLMTGVDIRLTADHEGLPSYPFNTLDVIYRWNRFTVGAGGLARILPGYHASLVARELIRLNHLSRLMNAVSSAHRQLERGRGGQPRPTDQIRVYGCIPSGVLDLMEAREVPTVQKQIENIIDAWGVRNLLKVHLSAN